MRNFLIILAAGLLLTAGHSIAGPIVKNQISGDADWVVHIDHDKLNKSQVGQIIRSEIVNRGIEEKFRNFKEKFSLHPLDDVNNVTIYGQGKDQQMAVVLIQGRFDKDQLLAFVGTNPWHKQIKYHGIDIQQWGRSAETEVPFPVENEQIMSGGFYDDDLIVLSAELSAIEHAFDVLEGSQPSAADDFFSDMVTQSDNVFLQVKAQNMSETAGDDPGAVIFRNTDQLSITIGEKENKVFVEAILRANSDESTESLKTVLEGMMAYLTLAYKDQPELIELIQKINLSSIEDRLQINLEFEPAIMEFLIQQQFPWQ